MSNLIGQTLGRYHILEQLGEGGMAIVYKAYDMRLETDVAVKVIRTENILPSVLERSLKRFEREAKSLARLTHPNIVKVMDYGEFEGQPYLVMEYLPGGTLREHIKQGAIPWQEAVRLLLPNAQALEYAHKQNLIHRDVKPSNILLTESGQPMLADFGIAKILDEEVTMDLTGTRATLGTPEYMSPEQCLGKAIDFRADIYALGVVLYEMVTGHKPFIGDTPMETLFKHVNEPLPRPRSFVRDLPDAVERILLKALAKKPQERYQRMGDLVDALDNLLTGAQGRKLTHPNQQNILDTFEQSRYAGARKETVTDQQSPILSTSSKNSPPKGAVSAAWFCFIPGFISGIGAIAGVGLLLGKNWARKLAVFYMMVLSIASAGNGIVFIRISYRSSYERTAALVGMAGMVICMIAVINLINLFSHEVRDYYMPEKAPHIPGKNLDVFGWLYIIFGFWLIFPVFAGVGLLVRRGWSWKMSYYTTGIVSVMGLLASLGSWFLLFVDPSYEIANFSAFLPFTVILFFPIWRYLHRADVKALFIH